MASVFRVELVARRCRRSEGEWTSSTIAPRSSGGKGGKDPMVVVSRGEIRSLLSYVPSARGGAARRPSFSGVCYPHDPGGSQFRIGPLSSRTAKTKR